MPPDWLQGEALIEWNRLTPELERLGLLALLDLGSLVSYCQAWGELADASKIDETEVLLDDSGADPFTKIDALAKLAAVRRKAREQVVKFSALFGLNPADRTRIRAPKKETKDPFESFLGKRQRA